MPTNRRTFRRNRKERKKKRKSRKERKKETCDFQGHETHIKREFETRITRVVIREGIHGYHRIIIIVMVFVTTVKVEPLLRKMDFFFFKDLQHIPHPSSPRQLCNNPKELPAATLVRILSTVATRTWGNTMACRECGKDEFLLLLLRVSTW